MNLDRKEASPIEVAALLMDAVCTPSEQEQDALRELAVHLGVDLARIQANLLYLRAFAVDFAMALTLGESAVKEAVSTQYYGHWDLIAKEAGEEVLDDLRARLGDYTQIVGDAGPNPEGLRGQIGQVFAAHCQPETQDQDLVLLGGAMFAALFEEIADLFYTVDIVLPGHE